MSVARVDFDSGDGTPTGVREEISKELQGRNFEQEPGTDYLNELANEIAEVSVRGALQNQGYFQATATAKLAVLQSGATEISVAAVISASPGPQYQAGDIRIESADDRVPLEMPAEKLRDLIPLQRDELFDVERVRAGLRNLTAAYGRLGYVDMTVEPEFQIEDAHN
ncbi:MAG: POTRA domain-containing protein, partial [Candidatus Acidiferrum sp.]